MERIIGWESASKVAVQSVAQLRRLVENGKLRASKDRKGRHVFRRPDLEAVRKASPAPPAPPPTGVPGKGTTPVAVEPEDAPAPAAPSALRAAAAAREELPGDLTAAVFADLEKRVSPVRIAIDRELSSGTVRRAVEEWRKLRSLDLNVPSVPGLLENLRRQVRKLLAAAKDHEERIAEVEATLNALPVPDKRHYTCEKCSAAGKIGVTIQCTKCGDEQVYGFMPKDDEDDEDDDAEGGEE
jgi:hypothetical protein